MTGWGVGCMQSLGAQVLVHGDIRRSIKAFMCVFRHLDEAEPLESVMVLSQLYSCIELQKHLTDLTCELLNRTH